MPYTLADPTNQGNAPGSGPLRPGGQSLPGLPKTGQNMPSTPSPTVQRQMPALALVRDLWGGTERLREKSTTYLPQAPGEASENYNVRLYRSVLVNFFRRTVDGLVGLVFRKDPKLGDDVPLLIKEHWENIDLAGTHGDVFAREIMQDAKIAGHAAILVEYPATGGTQTAKPEVEGIIRPYWVPIQKDNIRSWRWTIENGRRILSQVVLRECSYEPVGEFGEEMVERYRVFYRDNGVVGFRLLRETENKELIIEAEGLYPTQDEIPIAEIPTSGSKALFDSDPSLEDVAHLNVAHYQQWSDYATSIHKTCVPIFVTVGLDQMTGSDGQASPDLVLGPNAGLDLPIGGDAKYVSHDGASLASCKAALDDLKSDIGSLGLAMLAPQKRAAETYGAKRLDKATGDSALSVDARGLQDGLERALGFHARYLKLPDGGSIEINRDFEGMVMEPAVMSAFASLIREGLPLELALAELQAGGRLAEDVNLDDVALQMAAERAAQQDREQQAQAAQIEEMQEAA
jgi:hypothetical protein